ncbi:MAG: class I SAM-dependent methyltransferase [Pyrinomonadaceae bacterium]
MGVAERFQGANVVDAGTLSPYWGEHAARYRFALPFIESKTVLDIACGTGYGIAVLNERAAYTVGVDVDIDAAIAATSECRGKAAVLLGDGMRLPFADETFDAVTSFETLEHLRDRAGFLAEMRRVLKPHGKLVLSTPNANYTKPVDGRPANPFHVFEYRPSELLVELSACFEIEQFLGQTLDDTIQIPPFYDAQQQLPRNFGTQAKLFAWKVMNKLPLTLREGLSNMVWKKPFYPTEDDYKFTEQCVETAPVLVAVCRAK